MITSIEFIERLLEGYEHTISSISAINSRIGKITHRIEVSPGPYLRNIYIGETGIEIYVFNNGHCCSDEIIVHYADAEFKTKFQQTISQP